MRHNESRTQQQAVALFRRLWPSVAVMLNSVPNGMCTTPTQGRIAKAEGMTAGAPDLVLHLGNDDGWHSLMMEFKTATGRQSEVQKRYQATATQYGNLYVVVRSVEEFYNTVTAYMGPRLDKITTR